MVEFALPIPLSLLFLTSQVYRNCHCVSIQMIERMSNTRVSLSEVVDRLYAPDTVCIYVNSLTKCIM